MVVPIVIRHEDVVGRIVDHDGEGVLEDVHGAEDVFEGVGLEGGQARSEGGGVGGEEGFELGWGRDGVGGVEDRGGGGEAAEEEGGGGAGRRRRGGGIRTIEDEGGEEDGGGGDGQEELNFAAVAAAVVGLDCGRQR
mmetsp:Transcript_21005/g.42558  ORF Transcript_21005/g.42558 Transcript_21005/m.42558 type:complete len:137 (-) Transcript_21005:166-576(-)